MREVIENLVIGGGPAGAASSIDLARSGRAVTLLERKQLPHHKVCGEFISVEAAQQLESLGIDLEGLGAQAVNKLRLISGKSILDVPLPFTAWSLSRRVLDAALLEQASSEGVRVEYGTTANALQRDRDHWAVTAQVSSGETVNIAADCVFLATGKHDLRQWRRRRTQGAGDYIGFKLHLKAEQEQLSRLRNTVELHFFDEGYAGIEPVENGDLNLCFLVKRKTFHDCGKNWQALFAWLAETSPHMQSRLAGAVPVWSRPLAVYGTPYGYLCAPQPEAPGLFRLGDQAAVIPSLAGDGIAIALHSGMLAAQCCAREQSASEYHEQALKVFSRPVRNAQRIGKVLSSSMGREIALRCGRHWPGALHLAIATSRLPQG
ncbi:NAD(P)/FAD-dependent oxidoreductase [Proteobacteria bacterium 005FR1]|nr:NAD(P)/FAD-dependent oxidoreductase [Proteobacteria bacterium 005FR1]